MTPAGSALAHTLDGGGGIDTSFDRLTTAPPLTGSRKEPEVSNWQYEPSDADRYHAAQTTRSAYTLDDLPTGDTAGLGTPNTPTPVGSSTPTPTNTTGIVAVTATPTGPTGTTGPTWPPHTHAPNNHGPNHPAPNGHGPNTISGHGNVHGTVHPAVSEHTHPGNGHSNPPVPTHPGAKPPSSHNGSPVQQNPGQQHGQGTPKA